MSRSRDCEYIRHISIGEIRFSPGIIEYCRDGKIVNKGDNSEGIELKTPMKLRTSSEL
ncbi:DUF7688 family protein [Phocaeicola plebeius]|uniref:DUF7688 family protein n=1 Tax=Phocaeicola plebeius TaxID=310297 RepID=UPI003C6E20B1